MSSPLVSVVCLSHNHERFVKQAIDSVLNQRYPNIELVVVDDASSDQTQAAIREALRDRPDIEFLALPVNLRNCAAFNRGLALCHGDYIIDLAADDVLLPERVSLGVAALEGDLRYGVHFGDALVIDEAGVELGRHSDQFPHASVPQGDIFQQVLSRYFINPTTMMIRRSVLDQLGGYDETLAYEDFDFWVRSSRFTWYAYSPELMVKRRLTRGSMSSRQYRVGSRQMASTYRVCEKALKLCQNDAERAALKARLVFEARQSLRFLHLGLFGKYSRLIHRINTARAGKGR